MKKKKTRRPAQFNLSREYHLVPAYKGQKIFYLRPNANPSCHFWIEGKTKVRRLIKWLHSLEEYQK